MEVDHIKAIVQRSERMRAKHPELRHGQAMMNALFDESREAYDFIQPTENNPFYEDKKVPQFIQALRSYFD
jgi:hypothetical protein